MAVQEFCCNGRGQLVIKQFHLDDPEDTTLNLSDMNGQEVGGFVFGNITSNLDSTGNYFVFGLPSHGRIDRMPLNGFMNRESRWAATISVVRPTVVRIASDTVVACAGTMGAYQIVCWSYTDFCQRWFYHIAGGATDLAISGEEVIAIHRKVSEYPDYRFCVLDMQTGLMKRSSPKYSGSPYNPETRSWMVVDSFTNTIGVPQVDGLVLHDLTDFSEKCKIPSQASARRMSIGPDGLIYVLSANEPKIILVY